MYVSEASIICSNMIWLYSHMHNQWHTYYLTDIVATYNIAVVWYESSVIAFTVYSFIG